MSRSPYHGQPYQDQLYEEPQQYGPSRGNPGPSISNDRRPTQRRKRHWVRHAITGATVITAIIVGVTIASAENGRHTATTGQAAATRTSAAPIAASSAHLAGTGSVLVLVGHRAGQKMTVTLVKVFRHPKPAGSSDAPRHGDRLYAVQFRLNNTGSVAYSDSPSKSVVVVDSASHSYMSSLDHVTACHSFPVTENIAVGSSGLGCIVFEVPATAKVTKVWFTLASGAGAQSGQWQIRS